MKNYCAIILSAGYSSRMGDFKPLMDLCGKTPIQRCIELFKSSGINNIVVVTGHLNHKIKENLEEGITAVINDRYNEGMFSSIQAGVKSLPENTDAFFLLPVDIPSVKEHTVKKMMEAYEIIEDGILFPRFDNQNGHPTIIPCSLISEILEKNPEGGLRDILTLHKEKWHYEELADRGILLDMDTMEDFKVLCEHTCKAPLPDYEECMEMLRLNNTKQETIEHMISVSELSKKIAILLNKNGYNLDINIIEAGALLHDIAKGKKSHAKEGAKIVRDFGYGALSEIISEHMELKVFTEISEKEIVYISDKLIKGTKLISLNKRFEGAFDRYKSEPEILKNVMVRYFNAKIIKDIIENIIGERLENLR